MILPYHGASCAGDTFGQFICAAKDDLVYGLQSRVSSTSDDEAFMKEIEKNMCR